MSDVAYRPLTQAEDIFKRLVWDPLVASGQVTLLVDVPWLNLPVVSTVVKILIKFFSDKLFETVRLFTDVTAIRLVNAAHQSAYESASLRLKIIAVEKGYTSDEFIKARDEASVALATFVHIGPGK